MSDITYEPPDFKDMGEEELWDLINDNRHAISLGVRPCMLIPYLRQARVLSDLDEDEILTCLKFTNRSMRTSHMLDLLRIQGRNGAVALMEGLMIHYPNLYTQVTGRKPSTEPSRFSGLIKYSELTEYLVRAVTGMQKELQAEREEAAQLRSQCCSLQTELTRATQQVEEQKSLQTEHTRLRKSLTEMHRDLLKLKDEKCDLYVRYAAAVEEKSEVNIRCRDLNLQVYQLQCELRKAQTETDFQRNRSVRRMSSSETQHLRDEIITLRRQLQQAENITPACQDILAQDLKDATDQRTELADELRRLQEENEALTRERSELLEEKDCLALEVQKLTLDCEMYQQKSSVFQNQFGELQAERDRAYLARDEAQTQIASSLAEKDTLRAQLVDLQEKIFTLRAQKTQRDPSQSSERSLSWDSGSTMSCDSPPSSPLDRPKLRRMNALPPSCSNCFDYSKQYRDDGFNSARSSLVEPPCSDSLRRRETDPEFSDHSPESCDDSFCMLNLESDFEFLCKGVACLSPDSPESPGVSRVSAPPFLVRSRPQAVRITSRAQTLSFQGEALLSQLQVIGGNKTGVFVHKVTDGSAAHSIGISPGAQILEVKFQKEQRALRMHLEDSTMEEALWALGQVNGPCSLSLRTKQDAYQNLLQQLKSSEVTSGDSFYVRVNMSLAGGGSGLLSVTCNTILHVTDSHHTRDGYWWASHVHDCQLMDQKSGCVPNFYRAQKQLIRVIEDLSFQHKAPRKVEREQMKQKAVRIVSTARQGRNPLWVSVEEDSDTNSPSNDGKPGSMSLMPYTLVTPHFPPVCRPVLLLPTILRGILHKRLAEQKGYQLFEPETLSASEHAVRMQKGEILEECEPNTHCCYTVQGVEKIMKRGTHCVLPLGLDCVRRLHRAGIFPIIIFIASTERSARKLKHKLRQNFITETQVLECSWSEEPLLDKLPCLYRTVAPESWNDSAALLDNLQHIVQEEQRKIVWVEPDLW
ncbi:caspase recruitment domain-containing protein 14 isoform X1 [Ictalurus punctatus]|uniref:Caspase recruitment domain-containing protein 14 isoform X1 n=1 Tax=Ictalurus punctatus TaxID=7998 RepID=A0A9F7RQN6_ICTPU|nr:caspase recruitment domain-containing protein 14 isoform X1 [Ictalurus punctatus]XP_053540219.1 caspase recruitment domain-containing protein 14 isoform X1 [Ictalurus punctatus]